MPSRFRLDGELMERFGHALVLVVHIPEKLGFPMRMGYFQDDGLDFRIEIPGQVNFSVVLRINKIHHSRHARTIFPHRRQRQILYVLAFVVPFHHRRQDKPLLSDHFIYVGTGTVHAITPSCIEVYGLMVRAYRCGFPFNRNELFDFGTVSLSKIPGLTAYLNFFQIVERRRKPFLSGQQVENVE